MKFLPLFAALSALSVAACAQSKAPAATAAAPATAQQAPTAPAEQPKAAPGSADAKAIEAVRKLSKNVPIDSVGPAPLPGYRQVVAGGQVLFVSDDGRYLMQGIILDMTTRKDISQQAIAVLRKDLLAQVPKSERIVFTPVNPKHIVTVFTDVECGFCRKLHGDIAQYNKLGIAIEYLAFPRMGPASEDFRIMEAVWCSPDRNKALTDSKNGKRISAPRCTNPVARQYALGQRVGLQGTPMIIASNGVAAPGYLGPADLLKWLEENGQ